MKILNIKESQQWLVSHGCNVFISTQIGIESHIILPEDGWHHRFEIGRDAELAVLLAHQLASWLPGPEVMLWVTYWDGPNDDEMEKWEVLLDFRTCESDLGQRPLLETPGHLFDLRVKSDQQALRQMLLFLMAFNWEGYLVQDSGQIIWFADEVLHPFTVDLEHHRTMSTLITKLGIKTF